MNKHEKQIVFIHVIFKVRWVLDLAEGELNISGRMFVSLQDGGVEAGDGAGRAEEEASGGRPSQAQSTNRETGSARAGKQLQLQCETKRTG